MPALLGEDRLVDLVGLPAREGYQRPALEEVGRLDPGELAQRGMDVEVGDERIGDVPATEPARAAHDEHHAEAAVEERGLRAGEGDAVIGGEHDQRALGEASLLERVQHLPHALVERACAGPERRRVPACGGHVRQVRRRLGVDGVTDRSRLQELPVGLEEDDVGALRDVLLADEG